MRRSLVYGVAGAAFGLALVLTLAGVGDDPDALTNPQALVLGLVQGFTELLPISSSGHLILVPWAADWTYLKENDRFNQTFDVALHLGTLVAVGAYFWGDLVRLVRAFARSLGRRRIETSDERIAWFVLVATIPAGVVGLVGEDAIADSLGRAVADRDSPRRRRRLALVGGPSAAGTGNGRPRDATRGRHGPRPGARARAWRLAVRDHDHRRASDAPRPGCGRALLVPSPPADRPRRARAEGSGGRPARRSSDGWQGPFLVGTLASLASGLLAIDWLLGYVRRHTYDVFVWYRLVVAAIIGLAILSGVREASF